jgi:hypothetical protein
VNAIQTAVQTAITFPEVWDSSMLAAFKACPQLCFKTYFANWKSKAEKIDLHAGKVHAIGLEYARRAFFEEGVGAEDAEALGLREMLKAWGDFECPQDHPKSLQGVARAYSYYMDSFPLTMNTGFPIVLPGGKRAIEVSDVLPLALAHPETGQPLLYSIRADMVVQYAGGIYGEDDKTTSRLGPTWSSQWDLRSQFIGYTWGLRQSLNVNGFLVRGVSMLKTKNEAQEAIVNFSSFEVDRWYGELLEWLEDIIRCWRTKRWRYNLDHSCSNYGGCGFRTVCKAEDERPWLEQFFERRKWDPVTRQEIKL